MADQTDVTLLARTIAQLEEENLRLRAELARSAAADDRRPGPYFVGGTGRSGTWLVGRLLGRHPDVIAVPTELRFHASEGGFGGVLDGTETPAEYAERVRARWFDLAGPHGTPKGLLLIATSAQLAHASRLLVDRSHHDRAAALASFVHHLVDPFAFGRGNRTWVETTPDNSSVADQLTSVFPSARVVNIVRDGRDSAASVTSMPWGPREPLAALEWWEQRVRAADTALRRAPADRVHHIRFEELALIHRERELQSLLAVTGLEEVPEIRRYFDRRVDASRAHVGRWRTEISKRKRKRFDREYRQRFELLRADGVVALPIDPDVADELTS